MSFFAIGVAVIAAVNVGLLRRYAARRYEASDTELARKVQKAQEAIAGGHRLRVLFAGDSTVSCGISPRLLGPDAFNMAWSGFEPSALPVLERLILSLPTAPEIVFLGVNPTYLSNNDWANTLSVPLGLVAREALTSFYDDTNSFRPLVLMGGLVSFANRLQPPSRKGIPDVDTYLIEDDGLFVAIPERRFPNPLQGDLALPFRASNFRMIEDFRGRLARRGVRVVWLAMPYPSATERMYREGPAASRFFRRYEAEIGRIFGRDVVDLAGAVPDDLFREGGHLFKAGARVATLRLKDELARLERDDPSRGALSSASAAPR